MKNGAFAPEEQIFHDIFKLLKCKKKSENFWKFELFMENDAMF